MKYIILFLKGILIGVTNVIPGVSGGTIAVITGIYEEMIQIIGDFTKKIKDFTKIKKDVLFISIIGIGAVAGILVFSNLIKVLLESYNMPLFFCFLGLVIGSFPYLFKLANKQGFKKSYIIPFCITFIIIIILDIINKNINSIQETMVLGTSPLDMLKLCIYGFVSGGTLIVPGISGAMVIIIMGIYDVIIDAVSNLNIAILIPFSIGIGIGIVVFSKIIKKLLEKFYGYTYYAILGFVAGTVIFLFPGFIFNMMGLISVIVFIISFILSYKISMV